MTTPYRPPPPGLLKIIYRDDYLVVVDKPGGLLSVPGRGAQKADCLVSRLNAFFPGVLIVHRLDMETSGLIVLARTAPAHRALSKLFENREVEKTYTARVMGAFAQAEGRIDLPLMKDWPNRPLQKVDRTDGKPSVTLWRVVAQEQGATRLDLTPLTGRTHQLRVHLNAIGHPILGDLLYGTAQSQTGAARLQLHASALSFVHPGSGLPLMLQSRAPF